MKEEIIEFGDVIVIYYIGTNAKDNFDVIDKGEPTDYWLHAKDCSSCHVVVKIPDKIEIGKKLLRIIIKKGAMLCKQHTNKLTSQSDVEIIYTHVKNIQKTEIAGCVNVQCIKIKTIIC